MDSRSLAATVARQMVNLSAAVTRLPHGAKVSIVFFLAVPQLYFLPQGNRDIALSTAVTAILAPGILVAAMRGPDRNLFRIRLFQVVLGLLAVRLLALTWSPDPGSGLQSIVLLGQFVIVLVLMSEAARKDANTLQLLQRAYWPWVVFEACLVILFRVLPDVEHAFLRSVAGLFVGHNTLADLFGGSPNNVLDVVKSGGVFVNANVAAMFLGISGLAGLAVASVTGTQWVRNVAIFALVAVPFTGSKSGTILAFALPAIAFALYRLRRSATPAVRRYLLISAALSSAVAVVLISTVDLGFFVQLRSAFVGRTVIWGFGAEAFQDNPVLGLGYGGWEVGYASYVAEHDLDRGFPPHNILLAAWSKTGIAGLVPTVMFFALAFRLAVRGLRHSTDHDAKFVIYAGAAFSWALIQGMGENTDVFGEIHLIPVLALLIGYLIVYFGEEMRASVTQAYGRHRETSTLPAIRDVHRQPGLGATRFHATVPRKEPRSDHAESGLG